MALELPSHIIDTIKRRYPFLDKEDILTMVSSQFNFVIEKIGELDMKPVLLHRLGTFSTSQETIDRIREHSTKNKDENSTKETVESSVQEEQE